MTDNLYFKQIEMGPMQNFVYLVGSLETRKVAVVDGAWDIEEILRIVAEDDMELTHACVSHTHPDHIGGQFSGVHIQGITELLEKAKVKVIVHKEEAEFLKALSPSDLIRVDSGDEIDLGGIILGCQAGPRSNRAAELLQGTGFQNISNVRGGFGGMRDPSGQVIAPGWSSLGLPVSQENGDGVSYESLASKAK